jgi:hypothetical protein
LLEIWTWGLFLIALTIAIHVIGVTFLVVALHNLRRRLESRSLGVPNTIAIVVCVFTGMGLLLVVLHAMEAAIWAAALLWLGALDSPGPAILYSIDSMTTRGASGVRLHPHWRILGAMEAADGMLLFGISTAFIFTVMQFYYQHLMFLEAPRGRTKTN